MKTILQGYAKRISPGAVKHSIQVALAVAGLMCAAITASAQSSTPMPISQIGLPANGTFSGGSIDSVQLNNGNLHIDIPILHLPGIGMDTDIHFVYDNKIWSIATFPTEAGTNPGPTGSTPYATRGYWMLQDPLSEVSVTETGSSQLFACQRPNGGGTLYFQSSVIEGVALSDPDGTEHAFPGLAGGNATPTNQTQDGGCLNTPGWLSPGSYADDTSGYYATTTSNGNIATVQDRRGRTYTMAPQKSGPVGTVSYPAISVEDANGNRITSNSNSTGSVTTITDTVNRAITETAASSGAGGTIAYTDQNGNLQNITINYVTVPLSLCGSQPCPVPDPSTCGYYLENFNGIETQEWICNPTETYPTPPSSVSLPSSIVLQNGDTYTITYNSSGFGEVQSITLPTGAVISYTYGNWDWTGAPVLSRTVTANGVSSVWNYNYKPVIGIGGGANTQSGTVSDITTVTDPNLNDTVYTCTVYIPTSGGQNAWTGTGPAPCFMTKEQIYSGSSNSGTLIATRTTGYSVAGVILPTSETFTWAATGQTSETDTTYDTETGGMSFQDVLSKKVYDYGVGAHGALLSNTQYSYLYQQKAAYANANMLDLVSQVSVYNAAGALAAQTTTGYDSFTNGGQSGLATTTGTTQHDYTNYSSAKVLRGLPTSVAKCAGSAASPCLVSVTSYTNYNDLGKPTVSTDGRGYSTTYTYGTQNAFLATTTMPATSNGVAHLLTSNYDVNTGLLLSKTDYNNNQTTYTYDARMRPQTVSYPDGGFTSTSYTSPNQVVTAVNESVTAAPPIKPITGGSGPVVHNSTFGVAVAKVTTTDLDGLGRTISVSTNADATCGSLTVNTQYDLMGRVAAVSNPHCNGAQSTDGWTSYYYDAIGRMTMKVDPDGSPTSGASTWSYLGNAVTSYDQVGYHSNHTYDAQGRLTQVLEEPAGTPALETDYAYDTLGDLLSVNQWGGPMNGSGTGDHLRSFAYDALSRLIASYNPESTSPSSPASRSCPGASGFWATCYAYDNDSNIANKTDNRGITTTYSYDPLDRLLSKTYTDSTPSVSYTYDTYAGTGGVNDVGNPTMATVSSGSTVLAATVPYAYDPMGRLTLEAQCTPANCVGSGPAYNLAYTYNLGGKLTSATFPSNAPTSGSTTPAGQPVTLSYAYDNAERLLTVSSSWADSTTHPATLFQASTNSSAPGYGPMGIENADLGIYTSGTNPTLNLLRSYDDRGRLNYEAASSSAITGTDSSGGTITIGGSEQQVTEIAAPGTTTFYVEGAEGSHQGGCILYWPYPDTSCETYAVIPDGGGFTVTVTTPAGPITASGGYGSGSTTATVAQSLAASFTSQGFPATVTGSIVKVQANTTGLSSNYSFTVRQTDSDFSLYGGTPLDYLTSGVFTGGWTGGTFYDTGYIHARVSGTEVDVPWSQGSTPASLATSLAAAINSAAGTFVMATANGATVNLTSLSGGPETDYTVTASVTDTNPFYFSDAPPSYYTGPQSFSVSTTNMSGGQTTSSSLYSFLIPVGTGYWPNGDLLHVTDSVTGTWSYGYDGLNRLGGAVSSAGPYAGAGISWSYDPFGNRTSQIVSGTPSAPMPTSNTASYTAASNQVSTSSLNNGAAFSYDAAGDVTYDGLNSYLYDAEGRLCAVKNYVGSLTGYVYDAAGARVAKGSLTSFSCNFSSNGFSTTSSYVLEPGGNQVTEYSVSGATSTWVHTNAFDAGGLVASYHDTATYFNVPDWLGTKRAEVGTNGCTSTFASMPYGDGLTASGNCPDATEHHFTGKERDQESGNDYFGARYYASRMGSWMSPDWSAKIEPVPYAKLDNPQSLNLYAYLENNPVDRVDPNGHCNPNDWGCNPWDADYGKHFLTANEEAQRQQIAYNINNFDKIVNAGVDDILNSVKSGNVGGLSQYVYDNATIALNSGGNFEAIGQARYNIGDELGKMLESSIHDEVSTFLKTAGTTGMEALAGEIAHHDRMSAPSSRDKGIKWAVDKVSDKLFGETMPYLSFAYKWLQRAPRSEETHDDAIDQIDQHLGKN